MSIVNPFPYIKETNQAKTKKKKENKAKKVTNNANEFNCLRFAKRRKLQHWLHPSNIILQISWLPNNSTRTDGLVQITQQAELMAPVA